MSCSYDTHMHGTNYFHLDASPSLSELRGIVHKVYLRDGPVHLISWGAIFSQQLFSLFFYNNLFLEYPETSLLGKQHLEIRKFELKQCLAMKKQQFLFDHKLPMKNT